MGCTSPEDPIQRRFNSVGLGPFVSNLLPGYADAAGPHFVGLFVCLFVCLLVHTLNSRDLRALSMNETTWCLPRLSWFPSRQPWLVPLLSIRGAGSPAALLWASWLGQMLQGTCVQHCGLLPAFGLGRSMGVMDRQVPLCPSLPLSSASNRE